MRSFKTHRIVGNNAAGAVTYAALAGDAQRKAIMSSPEWKAWLLRKQDVEDHKAELERHLCLRGLWNAKHVWDSQ